MIETNAIITLKQIPKKNSNRTFLIDSYSGKQIQYKTLDEKAKGIGKLLKDFNDIIENPFEIWMDSNDLEII